MNPSVRRLLTATPLSRRVYFAARQKYWVRRVAREAGGYFLNTKEFMSALNGQGSSALVDLRTADGLTITIRQNSGDVMTVSEIFLSNCYVRHLTVPPNPVVIDVGGFIGDFALYAVRRLNARRVIVCEPSPRNWRILLKNIANNGYGDRIEPVNMAVTEGGNVMMNIDAPDESQCMVSAYATGQSLTSVAGISLSELLKEHRVDTVDLLKIDCEGGEFAILESTPSDVYSCIRNIVFEYHQVEGLWSKLESVKQRLRQEGYALHVHKGLVSASRA
jgi:FkbM family methyltransferase